MPNLTPIGDRVLVIQDKKEESAAEKAGIVVPETANMDNLYPHGKVVSVGDGDVIRELKLIQGETVYFDEFAGVEVPHEGVTYKLLRPEEVLAKLGTD